MARSTVSGIKYVMRQKFMPPLPAMLPLVLEHLTFRSENRFQPVIEALARHQAVPGHQGAVLPRGRPGGRRRPAQLARDGHRRARGTNADQPAVL